MGQGTSLQAGAGLEGNKIKDERYLVVLCLWLFWAFLPVVTDSHYFPPPTPFARVQNDDVNATACRLTHHPPTYRTTLLFLACSRLLLSSNSHHHETIPFHRPNIRERHPRRPRPRLRRLPLVSRRRLRNLHQPIRLHGSSLNVQQMFRHYNRHIQQWCLDRRLNQCNRARGVDTTSQVHSC